MRIEYTFPADCPIAELRGETFGGGEICDINGQRAVRFYRRVGGRGVVAIIKGKPDLEAQIAQYDELQARAADARQVVLDTIGWRHYAPISRAAYNASCEYDRAQDRGGYPAREAAAAQAADEALQRARLDYPLAAAYARALAYAEADNHHKAAAGRRAVSSIESGADVIAAVAAMESEWSQAAHKAVTND